MSFFVEGAATSLMVDGTDIFMRPFFCDGSEKRITECILGVSAVGSKLCSSDMVTFMMCQLEPGNQTTEATFIRTSLVINNYFCHYKHRSYSY